MNIDSFLKTNASTVISFVIIQNNAIIVEALGRNTSTQLQVKNYNDKNLDAF